MSTVRCTMAQALVRYLCNQFTIIENGRGVLTMSADVARERYQKIHARFVVEPAALDFSGTRVLRQRGKDVA